MRYPLLLQQHWWCLELVHPTAFLQIILNRPTSTGDCYLIVIGFLRREVGVGYEKIIFRFFNLCGILKLIFPFSTCASGLRWWRCAGVMLSWNYKFLVHLCFSLKKCFPVEVASLKRRRGTPYIKVRSSCCNNWGLGFLNICLVKKTFFEENFNSSNSSTL